MRTSIAKGEASRVRPREAPCNRIRARRIYLTGGAGICYAYPCFAGAEGQQAVEKLMVPKSAITEAGVTIHATVAVRDLQPSGALDIPVDTVTVSGHLQEVGEAYLFSGTVSGVFERPCDRCLEPAASPFRIEVLWDYRPGPSASAPAGLEMTDEDEEPEDAFAFEGNDIDLAPQVWEELVLAAPAKLLCRTGCAGLCPRCGANLNRGRCACAATDAAEAKGLGKLADLFPDLKLKNPEE